MAIVVNSEEGVGEKTLQNAYIVKAAKKTEEERNWF